MLFASENGAPDVFQLPPLVINEEKETRWQYSEVRGFEILSECSERETQAVIDALARGRVLTLPSGLRAKVSLPMVVVLFDRRPASSESVKAMGSKRGPGELNTHWTNLVKRVGPDGEVFCANLWGRSFRYSSTFRVDLRTSFQLLVPPAPIWLHAGFFGPYGIYDEHIEFDPGQQNLVELTEANWCSPLELQEARNLWMKMLVLEKMPEAKRVAADRLNFSAPSPLGPYLFPMRELWAEAGAPADAADYERWASTCSLFVRWALFADSGRRAHAFWAFVDEARIRAVSEESFRKHFGMDFAATDLVLSWYFPRATSVRPGMRVDAPELPKITLRRASSGQIARMLGAWERSEISAAEAADRKPDAEMLTKKAGDMLEHAYEKDSSDAGLQMQLALFEYEHGTRQRSLELLEALHAKGTMRPLAHLRLGSLRFENERIKATVVGGRLTRSQIEYIQEALRAAYSAYPAMLETYALLADVWAAYGGSPSKEDLAVLWEGVRLFPKEPMYLLKVARLYARSGFEAETAALCRHAEALVLDQATADQFHRLQKP